MAAASLPLARPTWRANKARSAISAWISRSLPSICARTAARSGFAAEPPPSPWSSLLAMSTLEIGHVIDQRLHPGQRHRVVDGRAHAADHAMPLEADQAGLARFDKEGLVERGVGQEERHVHARAHGRLDLVAVPA